MLGGQLEKSRAQHMRGLDAQQWSSLSLESSPPSATPQRIRRELNGSHEWVCMWETVKAADFKSGRFLVGIKSVLKCKASVAFPGLTIRGSRQLTFTLE